MLVKDGYSSGWTDCKTVLAAPAPTPAVPLKRFDEWVAVFAKFDYNTGADISAPSAFDTF
jgi:hypothetical protein